MQKQKTFQKLDLFLLVMAG